MRPRAASDPYPVCMSIVTRLARLASSPQARQLAHRATQAAKAPKTRQQIEQVRRRVASRGRKP